MNSLTEIMNRNGSDKGSGHHNYTTYYSTLFENKRHDKLNILEFGIGTINKNIPSSMCGTPGGYTPGSSLRGWKEYFTNSHIYGCDIDTDILFQDERINTFFVDQTVPISLKVQICDQKTMYDIMIDDGLHHFRTNLNVLKTIYSKLNKNGIYIIEDIVDFDPYIFDNDDFIKQIRSKGDYCEYHVIPNEKNNIDNNLIVVKKHSI